MLPCCCIAANAFLTLRGGGSGFVSARRSENLPLSPSPLTRRGIPGGTDERGTCASPALPEQLSPRFVASFGHPATPRTSPKAEQPRQQPANRRDKKLKGPAVFQGPDVLGMHVARRAVLTWPQTRTAPGAVVFTHLGHVRRRAALPLRSLPFAAPRLAAPLLAAPPVPRVAGACRRVRAWGNPWSWHWSWPRAE